MADKRDIRQLMRGRAAAFLCSGQAEAESARILSRLEALPAFRDAGCVLLYMALPDEVQTVPLLERWYGSKRLLLPRVAGEELELFEFRPGDLQDGYRGILEPSADAPKADVSEVALAIVPGIAFAEKDGRVWRLGRGKGFYDRFLPRLSCPAIGICYPFRVLEDIPTDPWDRPLDGLIY
ncbi:MAG: 5-formyltetrahydrofolate cyclo-ligase [Bacteroidales bacterium]|nr:5-formyltetrahydrofolate cyclo-ligase [Bacteroidales bacterium]